MTILPLEFKISDTAAFGFLMFAPTILFFIICVILFLVKQKKIAKTFLILSGVCLLIAVGCCGIG